jgi:adenylate kinase family enzyme
MLQTLTSQGYKRIPVTELISLENQRLTHFGKIFMNSVASGKVIPPDDIVRFLRRVVYSGDGHDKYILTEDFPTTIDQVREFEKSCATVSAVIYSGTRRDGGDGSFNISTNQLRNFETKSLFLKEFRLNTMSQWDENNWQEIFDHIKLDWCLVTGQPMSGKSTTAATLRKALGGPSRVTVFELKDMEDKIKPTLGTPEEPFEGKVPQAKIEEYIVNLIKKDK